jgi:hypothetical protein
MAPQTAPQQAEPEDPSILLENIHHMMMLLSILGIEHYSPRVLLLFYLVILWPLTSFLVVLKAKITRWTGSFQAWKQNVGPSPKDGHMSQVEVVAVAEIRHPERAAPFMNFPFLLKAGKWVWVSRVGHL